MDRVEIDAALRHALALAFAKDRGVQSVVQRLNTVTKRQDSINESVTRLNEARCGLCSSCCDAVGKTSAKRDEEQLRVLEALAVLNSLDLTVARQEESTGCSHLVDGTTLAWCCCTLLRRKWRQRHRNRINSSIRCEILSR